MTTPADVVVSRLRTDTSGPRQPNVDAATAPSLDWRMQAACRSEDPELFFPVSTSGPALRQIETAKAVCHRCPVCARCLDWAMESGINDGIWGGLTEAERRTLARSRNRV